MTSPGERDGRSSPLGGVLVVDLSRHLPGPLAARLLADLGARVVKVEEPELGDPVRLAPPFVGGRSSLAGLLLAGVESVALDFRQASARDVLQRLLEGADVLLESFRPGTLERWGLAPKELRRRMPSLVICSLSGWGQDGPYALRAGHDLTYQAVAGSLAATVSMPAVPVADLVGAWSAVTAVISALYRRRLDGEGCWIDQALVDAAGHANLMSWAVEADRPREVGEALPLSGSLPCYQLYRTRDGRWLALGALEKKFWRRFCSAAGRDDLVAAQYESSPEARRKVAAVVAERRLEEWIDLLAADDLPAEPVLSAQESLGHPQVRRRSLIDRMPDGSYRVGFPALLDGCRPLGRGGLPALGQHTAGLLRELDAAAASRSRRRLRVEGIGPRRGLKRFVQRFLATRATRR